MAELTELLDESTRLDNPNAVAPSIVGTVIGKKGIGLSVRSAFSPILTKCT
jgi:hypothetical protein